MDVLIDVLETLRLAGGLYCRSDLSAPWGGWIAPTSAAVFHVVDRGECWLRLDGEKSAARLSGGDLAVLPRGRGHRLSDEPDTPARLIIPVDDETPPEHERFAFGGGGAPTVVLCGVVRFESEHRGAHPLITTLPPVIVVRAKGAGWPGLDATLRALADEAGAGGPGTETIVRRLSDVLFVLAVRAWAESRQGDRGGWIGALRDPRVGAALVLIHRDPGLGWTIASLASGIGMPRSAFAAHFGALVGEPPLRYLTRWRMNLAADALRGGDATVASVARRVGYRSEGAFSKTFKQHLGVSPGAYRRNERLPELSGSQHSGW